jgi:hypothetical protein
VVKVVIGMDGGSTSSKAVLIDFDTGELLKKSYMLSKGNPIADTKEILAGLKKFITDQGAIMEVKGFGATGYAADVLKESVKSDTSIVETVAHMMSATHYFGDIDVICDIGGQDIKVLFMQNGDIKNFRLSNQCSGRQRHAAAGDGRPVRRQGDRLRRRRVRGQAVAQVQLRLRGVPRLGSRQLPEGRAFEGGAARRASRRCCRRTSGSTSCRSRAWRSWARSSSSRAGRSTTSAALKAQVDYIKARVPGAEVYVHPHTGRGGRDRRRDGDPPRGHAQGALDVHRHRRRDRP